MKQGLVKIDTIVREALADKGYSSLHKYPRYLMFVLRMLRKLNIDYSETIKTKEIPITKRKTVPYPEDYIAYNKIGVKVGDRMWVLTRDNSITTHTSSKYDSNPPFYQEAKNVASYRFYNYYPYVDGINSSYWDYVDVRGYAHNGVGYFTDVEDCREFQLSSDFTGSTVILEYIATNFDPDTETFIPVLAQDVFREYIHWQESRFSTNVSLSEVMANDREFWSELGRYNMRMSDLSYDGILDTMRRNTTLSIKR
jgi:hypothetical protein